MAGKFLAAYLHVFLLIVVADISQPNPKTPDPKKPGVKEGLYTCHGTETDGKKYFGLASIKKADHRYVVSYQLGAGNSFVGMGVVEGEKFVISWHTKDTIGLTIYQIEHNALDGKWNAMPRGQGRERLTFKEPFSED